eukprot:tig00021463_g21612.t1
MSADDVSKLKIDEPAKEAKPAKEKKPKEDKKAKEEKKGGDTPASANSGDVTTFSAKKANFAEWYEQILIVAEIVDKRYPVKGMPVFRGYGFYMHNRIMEIIEKEWEKQDIEKSQFPLVIPQTFLEKEKDHVKGFESECFWVTKGGLNELEVKLALRPTSETAMYYMFAMWVRSFRDLPLKVHQTCNVFRHETKDTRPLIRVREIHWNEAHTCHATPAEAIENLEAAWASYNLLITDNLGVYGLRLRRPDWDKFAGSEHTDVMDSVMPCGRVLQIVGAHYLGQKFAKVFDIKFLNKENQFEHAYMTCYGISTRVLASCLSVHGDDRGLVLPPVIARYEAVIVPIVMAKKGAETSGPGPIEKAHEYKKLLQDAGLRVTVDDSDKKPGEKYYFWEMKGVPLRVEIGPRDVQNGVVTVVSRDTGEKKTVPAADLAGGLRALLGELHARLTAKSKEFHESKCKTVTTTAELQDVVRNNGGFARFPFFSMGHDAKEADKQVHEICGGEVRGFRPDEAPPAEGTKCLITGQPAKYWAYAARSY